MSALKKGAILLVVVGGAAFAYGGFSFTKDERNATFGPFTFTSREREVANVPMWGAVGAIVLGALVLMSTKRGTRTRAPAVRTKARPHVALTGSLHQEPA